MSDNTQEKKGYHRFSTSDRFEHIVLLVSFTMLGVTGLPQRYADAQLAQDFIDLLGGIESVRFMHRFFAVMLMGTAIYHGGALSYKVFVKGARLTMSPGFRDVRDAWQTFLYNLGLTKEHPRMPRFNFGEKAEYLAVVWGTVLMIITGFMMWNPIATSELLPASWIPAARFAHSAEALLAIAAIIIWHMYNVHIKRFNRSMFTGELSQDAMEEEHAEELEAIQAGKTPEPVPEDVQAKRRRVFFPYAIVMSIILIAGLYYFVTFEKTAIDTVARQSMVDVTQIDPEVGDAALGAELWSELTCLDCHGESGEGVYPVPPLQSIDVDIQSFAEPIRTGPADMPAYPPGKLSDEEIAHLYAYLRQ